MVWAIDLGGDAGRVKHNVNVLPKMLPITKERLPFVKVNNLFVDIYDANKEFNIAAIYTKRKENYIYEVLR